LSCQEQFLVFIFLTKIALFPKEWFQTEVFNKTLTKKDCVTGEYREAHPVVEIISLNNNNKSACAIK